MLPANIATPELAADPEVNVLELLRGAIGAMDERRAELVEAGDWEGLVVGLSSMRRLSADLRALADLVERDVAELLPERRVELEGVGVIEKQKRTTRRAWESDRLLAAVVRKALDPEGTGEIPYSPMEAVAALTGALTAVVPFTGSLGWRVTALRDMGFEPGDFCEETDAGYGVRIHD